MAITLTPKSKTTARGKTFKTEMMSLPMGARLHPKGCTFKVWAPHAEAVQVIGSFNDWGETSFALQNENGFWYGGFKSCSDGDEYQYAITFNGETFNRVDPYAREVTNSVGNAVIRDVPQVVHAHDYRLPNHNELIIYELHVGTFAMSEDGQPGTFDELIDKLDYLKSLGVNVIQLMPIAEFAGDLSWGYNPAHIFAIETAYGGPAAFRRFVNATHDKGLGVIVDAVYNHFGPSDLDLWQFDGWSENDKGGIYFYNDHRSTTPWGDTRPDYGRVEVQNFILDNVRMWIEEYNVDGLRLDMTVYMRTINGNSVDANDAIPEGWELCQKINRLARQLKPNVLMISEDLQGDAEITNDEENGGAGFSAQWDKHFVHPVRAVITASDDLSRQTESLQSAIMHTYNDRATARIIYTESHDEVANGQKHVVSEVDQVDSANYHAAKQATLGIGLMMTSPGIPMLFQGQEFFQTGWFKDNEALDWQRVETFHGIRQMHQDLIRLRLHDDRCSALKFPHCNIVHHNSNDGVIAYQRFTDSGDACLVVVNAQSQQLKNYWISLDRAYSHIVFNSDSTFYREDFGNVGNLESEYGGIKLQLAPFSMLIII